LDKKYWEEYYKNEFLKESLEESSFADFCSENYIKEGGLTLCDVGCGSGRDTFYFSRLGLNTIAIDQTTYSLRQNISIFNKSKTLQIKVIEDNFVKFNYNKIEKVDIFYSRFTLHAITDTEEMVFLEKIFHKLNKTGLLLIEARTIKDPLFGKGKYISGTTFMTDHKRRFIDSSKFLDKVNEIGYKIVYFIEKNNLSIVGSDNPFLMRVVLTK